MLGKNRHFCYNIFVKKDMKKNKKIYIFIGPPGAGKDTQANLLVKESDLVIISPGRIFRKAVANKTSLGEKVKKYTQKGELVPDKIVNKIIMKEIAKTDGDLILDGFPRDIDQALALDEFFKIYKADYTVRIIELKLNEEKIRQRIIGRRSCFCGRVFHVELNPPKEQGVCDRCGRQLTVRPDSHAEVLERRSRLYKERIKPVIDFYKDNDFYEINEVEADG